MSHHSHGRSRHSSRIHDGGVRGTRSGGCLRSKLTDGWPDWPLPRSSLSAVAGLRGSSHHAEKRSDTACISNNISWLKFKRIGLDHYMYGCSKLIFLISHYFVPVVGDILWSACLYVCLSVCLFLCVRAHITKTCPKFVQFSVHATFDCGSVFLWR